MPAKAAIFRNEAKKLGLNVLDYEGTEERVNFSPMIRPLKAKNPGLVYFAGAYHQGGLLLRQLREKGANAKFMGPDSLDSAEMVKIAGRSVVGSYYTSVAGPPDAYPETAAFAKKFKQRFGKDIESFGMYGYDATMVGIKAMAARSNSTTKAIRLKRNISSCSSTNNPIPAKSSRSSTSKSRPRQRSHNSKGQDRKMPARSRTDEHASRTRLRLLDDNEQWLRVFLLELARQ